jgi:hypothetical protein
VDTLKIRLGELEELNWWHPIETDWFRQLLSEFGVQIVTSGQDVDWIDVRYGSTITGPTILFDRHDSSLVTPMAIHESKRPEVLAITIPLLARQPELSMAKHVYNRGEDYARPKKPVGVINTMPWYRCESEFMRDLMIPPKTITASFCGTSQYGHIAYCTNHRRRMIDRFPRHNTVCVLRGAPEYFFQTELLLDVLLRSQVVVCPWGVCEISVRDYEAVLGECMIVKPRQSAMDTTENPWTDGNTVWCDPDYSDLTDAIYWAAAKRDPDYLHALAERMKAVVYDPRVLAQRMAAELRRIYQEAMG